MPTYLVVRRRSGPEWDLSQPIQGQSDWEAHASFMDELEDAGFIVVAARSPMMTALCSPWRPSRSRNTP